MGAISRLCLGINRFGKIKKSLKGQNIKKLFSTHIELHTMKRILIVFILAISGFGLRAQDTINPFLMDTITIPIIRDSAHLFHVGPNTFQTCNCILKRER